MHTRWCTHAARLLACLLAAIALAGCGSSGGTGGGDKPLSKVTIVSDEPLTGSSRAQTESMVRAIKMKLDEVNYKVGDVPITFVSKDDATAQAGKWDEAKCTQNMTDS